MGELARGERSGNEKGWLSIAEAEKELPMAERQALVLERAMKQANAAIFAYASEDPARKGMGCTMSAALISRGRLTIGHVGDTRGYKFDGELRQLQLSQSLYVSGMKDYVMFYLEDEKRPLITHMTMKSVEEILPQEQFMRVSRSYIVAPQHIRKVDRNDCIYIGDEIIHVTDAYLSAFHSYLEQRM